MHATTPSRRAHPRHAPYVALVAAAVALLTLLGSGAPASSAPTTIAAWASPAKARIHPGTQMYTKGAQCTANFVFTDDRGRVYVGYAAHCAALGGSTDTNGCETETLPLGIRVTFREGGTVASDGTKVGTGRLAYSSWRTMQRIGTRGYNPCNYNDFALVRVSADDERKVNPTVPSWGGPTGIDRNGAEAGDPVYSYGSSSLLGGETALSPRRGMAMEDDPDDGGWTHVVYGIAPGVPGDSGSGYLSAGGRAIGVLSTLGVAPMPASNNITDLAKALAFAQRHSGIPGLRLVRGTRGFTG